VEGSGGGGGGAAAAAQPTLARELVSVYAAFRHGIGAVLHLRVNGWLAVSLSLSTASPNVAHAAPALAGAGALAATASGARGALGMPAAVAGIGAGESGRNPLMTPIRPYHTLLLLHDAEAILAALPPDASPQLAALVCVATPLRSFHELQGPWCAHRRDRGSTVPMRAPCSVPPRLDTDPAQPHASLRLRFCS
jgi:hypothetical protein